MSETQQGAQLSGKMFLFQNPELMSKEEHGALGISRPAKPYSFCANVRAIPITINEIPAAMKDYPIIFMSEDNLAPLAVVGVNDDTNLFVDDDGNWEDNRYIPGYVRRYPFGVASESTGDRMAIVIDRDFEGIIAGGEVPLFKSDAPTEATQQAIEFCKTYERDRQVSDEFAKRLKDYNIVQMQTAQYTPAASQSPQPFAQYFAVDEEKLNGLSDDQHKELRTSGMAPIIYATMMSLGNWRTLLSRRARRFGLSEDQIVSQSSNVPVN